MTRKFDELTEAINRDPKRRARVDRFKGAMRDEALAYSLSELRRSKDVTQVELADRLSVSQPSLSGIENRSDPRFSTLRGIVEGLGGRLEVSAVFEGDRYLLAIGDDPDPATDG